VADFEAQISGVPGRYAAALFELALEGKALDDVAGELNRLTALIDGSEDLARLVKSPVFSAEQHMRAMAAVLDKAGIKGLTANFVGLVAQNRRLFVLPDMIRAYNALLARHRGEVGAEVTSAQPLGDAQIKALKAVFKSSIGRDVNLTARVDESLLGGLVVKVGSRMVDTSLKTKLDNLQIAMKEVG
jgi:F-type H+-transporting ATPase subunit delta